MALGSEARSEGSHLGKSFRFKGEITGSEDLYIDGQIEGAVQLPGQVVTVGPQGSVSAEVQARDLIVHGKLKGNARAHDRIEVSRSGSVVGDLAMARISIQEGAFIQGRIDIRGGNGAAAPPAAAVSSSAAGAPAASPRTVAAPASAAPAQSSLLDHKP